MQLAEGTIFGAPVWRATHGPLEVRFIGRSRAGLTELAAALPDGPPELAWLRQIHSDIVLEARPGCVGDGDALWTEARGIGLAVATADCVPVVLGGSAVLAVVHAGWRGIAARIVPRTFEALPAEAPIDAAWIGPAIGACCYEVGEEVAARVESAAGPAAKATPGGAVKPHLDLPAAVAAQITAAQIPGTGPATIHRTDVCTRCHQDWNSYRRDGPGAGRNWTLAWLRRS